MDLTIKNVVCNGLTAIKMVTQHALSMTNRGVPWWKNHPINGRLMGFFASLGTDQQPGM